MTVGALLALPFGIADAGAALLRLDILALGAAVAVLSSTIPYAFELIALRRLPAAAFAILMSLAPATAALAGCCCSARSCRGSRSSASRS